MKKIIIKLILLLTTQFLFAQVSLTTKPVITILNTTATSGGNITNDGGVNVNFRGVCWSTMPNPTVALTTKTLDSLGVGTFTSIISGLNPYTTYYLRAYATNTLGTFYGKQQIFTTGILKIGKQVLTSQNLNVVSYRNGDIIPQVTNAEEWGKLTTGAWCWYYDDSVDFSTYGRLYNWYAVNDARGLAPEGWHLPSDAEWNKLVKILDSGADTTCRVFCPVQSRIAGDVMKRITGWDATKKEDANKSIFGGLRVKSGIFEGIGKEGYFWSSTANILENAWTRSLESNSNDIKSISFSKNTGMSVRCIKD